MGRIITGLFIHLAVILSLGSTPTLALPASTALNATDSGNGAPTLNDTLTLSARSESETKLELPQGKPDEAYETGDKFPKTLTSHEMEKLYCYSDNSKHERVKSRDAKTAAYRFCQVADHNYDVSEANFTETDPYLVDVYMAIYTGNWLFDEPMYTESFDMKITRLDKDSCNLEPGEQLSLMQPLPEWDCTALMFGAWDNCDNHDRGGAIDAGCLRYSIRSYKREGDNSIEKGPRNWNVTGKDTWVLKGGYWEY